MADDFQGTSTGGERYNKEDELRDEKGPHSAHGCALDDARAKAFVARSAGLLDAVYVPGSAARSADARTIAALLSGHLRVAGARHLVQEARRLPGSPIRVVVRDTMPSYPILDAVGKVVGRTTPRAAAARLLVLVSTTDGYRISQVQSA